MAEKQNRHSAKALMADYQFVKIGEILAPDKNTFSIKIILEEAEKWECAIYIFVFNDKIIRVGSSKGRLGIRMRQWSKDVTAALTRLSATESKNSRTPAWEAKAWQKLLKAHGQGEVYAREATTVRTPVGEFKAYMDEESILINRYSPPLNRHSNR